MNQATSDAGSLWRAFGVAAAVLEHVAKNGQARDRRSLRIGIVGAGFAGIGLAIQLKRAGFSNFVLFERAGGLGGTWRDNTYPGAACDVPSHLYSFSFAPKADWRSRYASQGEILGYLEEMVRRHDIAAHFRFGEAVARAAFDERTATWRVETSSGKTEVVDVFLPAVGQLSLPSVPPFAGLESFCGAHFHSARWDHSVDLKGTRIAVIGSAASAVQIVPELAKVAARVAVFQRSPNWLIPRLDWPYGPVRQALFRHLPGYRALTRASIYFFQEILFNALRTGSMCNRAMRRLALWHLSRQVHDPAVRAKLVPQYELGCKRVLISDNYYPCFNEEHVELITDPIDRFVPTGIQTVDGRCREFDIAVFATGFDVRNCLRPVEIHGRRGLDLQRHWSNGPEAYRGIAVPAFPNMFLLYGPNTNLGHNSILFMFECQFAFIVQCLKRMASRGLATLEVSPEATARFNRALQKELAATVWTTGCGNWYGDGGHITANWSSSTLRYWCETRRVDFGDFLEIRRHTPAGESRGVSRPQVVNDRSSPVADTPDVAASSPARARFPS
jgi:cation diffusion facilitator CzcD-associated flavoprotein CzcO